MAQDIPSSEIVIDYVNERGGKITITLDGEDFVLSASRTKPRPLVEQAQEYMGTVASSIWHHPTDVTAGAFLIPTYLGVFNNIAPQAQQNAQAVMGIAASALRVVWHDREHLRLVLQMLLVYQQTDLRGRMLLASSTRIVAGGALSSWIFSLGGRIKKYGAARIAVTTALSIIGSVYRVCFKMHQNKVSVMDTGPYPVIAAMITGEDRIFGLAQEIGVDSYFKIRTYLREHPEAIQLDDTELQIMQAAINVVFDFLNDAENFLSKYNGK